MKKKGLFAAFLALTLCLSACATAGGTVGGAATDTTAAEIIADTDAEAAADEVIPDTEETAEADMMEGVSEPDAEPQSNGEEQERMLQVNGVNLSVKEAGSGPDMILIHGRGFDKESMDVFFRHYQSRYHVVSYDVRGHGKTVAPGEFTLDDLSEDLAGLLSARQSERPVVIGFSMGSYIALRTAERYPGLFSKIVLIGTRGGRTSSGLPMTDEVARALEHFDNLTDAPGVSVPALVLTGENDAEGEKVADALPDARFEMIPGAEHTAYVSEPDRVLALIDEFLGET